MSPQAYAIIGIGLCVLGFVVGVFLFLVYSPVAWIQNPKLSAIARKMAGVGLLSETDIERFADRLVTRLHPPPTSYTGPTIAGPAQITVVRAVTAGMADGSSLVTFTGTIRLPSGAISMVEIERALARGLVAEGPVRRKVATVKGLDPESAA